MRDCVLLCYPTISLVKAPSFPAGRESSLQRQDMSLPPDKNNYDRELHVTCYGFVTLTGNT